jgi:WD40 repeat protein
MNFFRMLVVAILVASGLSGCRGPAEVGPVAEAKGKKPCPVVLDFATVGRGDGRIMDVAIAPNGQLALLRCASEQGLLLFDLSKQQLLWTTDVDGPMAIARDSQQAAWVNLEQTAAGPPKVKVGLWNLRSRRKVRDFESPAGEPRSMAFAPDGKHLVACLVGAPPTLWDVASGKIVRTFEGGGYTAYAVEFSPNGQYVLAQGGRLWEAATGKVVRQFKVEGAVLDQVAFSATGRYVLGSSEQGIRILEVATGHDVQKLAVDMNRPAFAVLPGGKHLLMRGTGREGVCLVELPTGRVLHTSDEAPGNLAKIAVAADGKKALLLLLKDSFLMLWDRDGDEVTILAHPALIKGGVGFTFMPDGKQALSHFGIGLTLWDVTTGKEVRRFRGYPFAPSTDPAVSADGRLLLAGGTSGKLWLWEAATGKVLWRVKALQGFVDSVALSPDSTQALVGGDDGPDPVRRESGTHKAALSLWDVKSGKLVRILTGHQERVYSVAISGDGKQALSGSDDGMVKLWDLASGKALWTMAGPVRDEWPAKAARGSLAFSADGRLALWRGRKLWSWDRVSGRLVSAQDRPALEARDFAFSPDGRFGLSGEGKGLLRLWVLASGKLVRTFQAGQEAKEDVSSVAFSPDGKLALSSDSKGTRTLWEVATGQRLRSWVDATRREPFIREMP